MNLAEKIIFLRKRSGWSQEELAQRMEVSRQAVSKWESGVSSPEIDKILRLSEIFGVTTDFLLHDELAADESGAPEQAQEKQRTVSAEEAEAYMETVEGVAAPISAAVAAFILSPVCLIQLLALPSHLLSENASAAIGIGALLLLVALGVAEIIPRAMRLSRYEYLEKESFTLQYGVGERVQQRKNAYEEQHRQYVMQGCVLCIVSVIPLLVVSCMEAADGVILTCVNVLLALVAAGVFLLVRTCIIYGSYQKLLQIGEYSAENKKAERHLETVSQVYWITCTAAYLAWSFLSGRWERTWILWPAAGVLFAVVQAVVRLGGKRSEE